MITDFVRARVDLDAARICLSVPRWASWDSRSGAEGIQTVAGHVFISYSRADRAYVDTLAAHLDDEAIPLWYDREMRAGDRFATEIQDQIDTCVGFVVVLTPAALGSEWVNRELSYAVHVGKRVLPLLLEPLGPGRDHILLAGLSRTA